MNDMDDNVLIEVLDLLASGLPIDAIVALSLIHI